MKKLILFCICIMLCLSTLTGCIVSSNYKALDLSKVKSLNSLSLDSFEYLGNTYNEFDIDLPLFFGLKNNHVMLFDCTERYIYNVNYFSALIGTIPNTRPGHFGSRSEYKEMIYASPYDPELNILLAKSSYVQSSDIDNRYTLFVKEGYVPFTSIYEIPLAELYRFEATNPEVIVQAYYGEEFNFPLYFRYKVGDLSGTNLTINDVISDELVKVPHMLCTNMFICEFDGHDYLSAFYYEICYDKDNIPYIRMSANESKSSVPLEDRHFYKVKEEYRDIFAWEYFGCEGHVDPDAKYDPENEGTENPGGEGTENPGGEGTENPGGEGTENPGGEGTENPGGEGTENPGGEGTENPSGEGDDTTAQ